VAYSYNPSTQEADIERSWNPSQPGLHSKTPSQERKQQQKLKVENVI
jgi:hypothetical protein